MPTSFDFGVFNQAQPINPLAVFLGAGGEDLPSFTQRRTEARDIIGALGQLLDPLTPRAGEGLTTATQRRTESGDIIAALGKVIDPFISGPLGESPATTAALNVFKQQALPVIQQQFELQGLGRSPALGEAVGQSLNTALVPFIQQELGNRLQAANFFLPAIQTREAQAQALAQERLRAASFFLPAQQALAAQESGLSQERLQAESLTQQAARQAADIAASEQERQLRALTGAGQLTLGLTQPFSTLAQLNQARQQQAIQGIAAGGEIQRNVAQEALDKELAEFLRKQALAEASTIGIFGGSVLPPTLQQTTKAKTSK